MSLSARRAWIEIHFMPNIGTFRRSLSARRAWIEILPALKLHKHSGVALRKESVDRNTRFLPILTVFTVALRKESVDRNNALQNRFESSLRSLSARRAWIEIPVTACCAYLPMASLSARRAWIEIAR